MGRPLHPPRGTTPAPSPRDDPRPRGTTPAPSPRDDPRPVPAGRPPPRPRGTTPAPSPRDDPRPVLHQSPPPHPQSGADSLRPYFPLLLIIDADLTSQPPVHIPSPDAMHTHTNPTIWACKQRTSLIRPKNIIWCLTGGKKGRVVLFFSDFLPTKCDSGEIYYSGWEPRYYCMKYQIKVLGSAPISEVGSENRKHMTFFCRPNENTRPKNPEGNIYSLVLVLRR